MAKSYTLRFGDKTVNVNGAGPSFTAQFVAAVKSAIHRGATLPDELSGMSVSEIRAYANNVPDAAGSASPVTTSGYGVVERSYEEEVMATTSVKDKASGAIA